MSEETHEMAGWDVPKHGEFVWTEIGSTDTSACEKFYSNVFGWKFKHSEAGGPMDYIEFSAGGENPVGGLYQMDPKMFGPEMPPPHFMTYIAVDDVDENAEKAKQLGATIIRGPMDIPNVGRMCVIRDPAGAVFSTFAMPSRGGQNG
jgi:predicted enzyme related to lactoylglutathione lyase